MSQKYRILHLEDVATDAELAARELQKGNFEFEMYVVDSEVDYLEALSNYSPDVILCDHSLSTFNSYAALEILKSTNLKIPFILITATLTDEVAINILRNGADDYILKDRLKRLPNAVIAAVQRHKLEEETIRLKVENQQREDLSKRLLTELSQKLLLATKVGGIGIWEYFIDENLLVADDVLLAQYGLANSDFKGTYHELLQYAPVQDKKRIRKHFRTAISLGTTIDCEFRIILQDAAVRFIRVVAVVQLNERGEPLRLTGTHQDVTDSKNAEQLIRENESRLAEAQAVAKMGSWETDLSTFEVIWSKETCRIFEIPLNKMTATHASFLTLVYQDDRAKVEAAFTSSWNSKADSSIEHRILTSSGSIKTVEERWHVFHDQFGKPSRAVGTIQDITEMKGVEEKLLRANRLYSFISQINQTIVRALNEQELFSEACRIAIEFGKFSVAWIGMFDQPNRKICLVQESGMFPEDVSKFVNATYGVGGPQDQVLSSGTYYTCNNVQTDLLVNDWKPFGLERGYNSTITLPILRAGNIVGTFNVYSNEVDFFNEQEVALLVEATGDISFALSVFDRDNLRKEVEDSLRISESNLQAIIENTDASIYSLDKNLCYITFNRALQLSLNEVFGLSVKPGDNVYSFLEKIAPQEALEWQAIYARALSGETVKFEKEFSGDNYYSCISFSIYPIWEDTNIIGLSCFAIDVTKQKQDLIQKEKLASDIIRRNKNLEQFSYIVSHNLRAPLANIIGLTYLLKANEDKDEETFLMEGISTSVKKLDAVIHDLNLVLQVNYEVNENKKVVSFSGLLADIQISISNLLRNEEVEIISDFSAVDEILTLKSYLYSIFFNLISNSIKYRRPGVQPVIHISSVKGENDTQLIFKDNGIGIDLAQNADKIFGLYKRFHSHTEGKGIGLYLVKTQLEALGGIISVDSEVNQGTTFRIKFQNP